MGFHDNEVMKALAGTVYPATPEELARQAASNGAHPEVIEAIRGAQRDYFSEPYQVWQELRARLPIG